MKQVADATGFAVSYLYNRYLIWGGVVAAALVRREGEDALGAAVDVTAEGLGWEISREFYVDVLPSVGFEDLDDLMELSMRGMYSDQYYVSGKEREEGGKTIKKSVLKNCELGGIFHRVAEWNGLPTTALGHGICCSCTWTAAAEGPRVSRARQAVRLLPRAP